MKTYPEFPNLFVIDHPLVQHKLTLMRSVDCSVQIFRDLLKEIAMLMGYEMTRDLPTEMKAPLPMAIRCSCVRSVPLSPI